MARGGKRATIMLAAKSVFAGKGYRAATVQDILDEAKVARATFYKYFAGKRHVFSEIIRAFLETLYQNTKEYLILESSDSGVIGERIRESLAMFYRLFLENRGVVGVYFGEAFRVDPGLYAVWDDFERRMTVLFARILERGIEGGAFRDVDVDLVARAMLMIFTQVPYREVMARMQASIDVESMADELSGFVMHGLAVDSEDKASKRE